MKKLSPVEQRLKASGYNLDKGYAPKAEIIARQNMAIKLALAYLNLGNVDSCKAILKSLLS